MEYNLNNLPNFGVLEVKLNQEQIDLLYKLINHAGGEYGWKIENKEVIEALNKLLGETNA